MMSIASRRELLAVVAPRYRAAQGKEGTQILEEFIASTGYHRKYALSLLNHPPTKATGRKKRARPRQYVFAVQQALVSTAAFFCAGIKLTPSSFIAKMTHLQGFLLRLFWLSRRVQRPPHPATGASPPGHPVVDGWRRDERTRGIPQSHLRALVSSA